MAELVPTPFAQLLRRMMREYHAHQAIFDLKESKWWHPPADDLRRTRVRFHGRPAGSPFGPAAGPHDQMAQNVVLSYLVGGRIMELKTVQILDELKIGRPCIWAGTVGYNIEWSQELKLEQSLEEYAKAAMLVHIIQRSGLCGGQPEADPVIYDISVGYDLKGITTDRVRAFMHGMIDATATVERLRAEIPDEFAHLRDLDYPTRLATSATLSTFHGCPPDEIERIIEHLIEEYAIHCVVKMNPTMLGRERVEHLVREKLGYDDIEPRPEAFTTGLQFDESIEICRRLHGLARRRGVGFGAKFTNTLETINTLGYMPDKVMYLSGRPLHVLASELLWKFRAAYGEPIEVTFSAGLEKANVPATLAMGCVPATTCTDLLKTGGFARMTDYGKAWIAAQDDRGAASWAEWIYTAGGNGAAGLRRALDSGAGRGAQAQARDLVGGVLGEDVPHEAFALLWDAIPDPANPRAPLDALMLRAMFEIQLLNAEKYVATLADNPLYHRAQNLKLPPKIDSHLTTFDCIACDKCIPVCPNDANYYYMVEKEEEFVADVLLFPGATMPPEGELGYDTEAGRAFAVDREHQIANFADWCNACGDCDTFCPEYDGPYIKKPNFYGSRAAWERDAAHDGFFVWRDAEGEHIVGRMEGGSFSLTATHNGGGGGGGGEGTAARYTFSDGAMTLVLAGPDRLLRAVDWPGRTNGNEPHRVDLWYFHCLRKLLEGALDPRRVTSVNVAAGVV